MASQNPVTRIIITAKDEASAVFGSLKAKVAAIAVAISGYFGGKLFGNVIGAARDFEAAMSAVQAASGASGRELAALKAAAEKAGATTKYTAVEAAGALENLAKSGLNAAQSVEALPAVLNLAQAGGVELGTAAEFITKAVNGMGLSFADAGRVADVLAMGANASSTSVEGLANALSFAAPVAQSLGLSLEQTVAIIGKFADAGIDASRAGTALNSMLVQFSDPASKFRRELASIGITTGDFDQALRQLAAAGPAGQKAILAVGQEAGPALRALLNQGIGALDELKGKLDQSAGSAKTFADVMSDNLDGATKGFGSAWDALLTKVGTPVLDVLKDQITAVADRLRAFVADGTATRFGEAIKSAFEAGGRWVQHFISKVDFKQVAADLQAFAARTGEIFDQIGQHAATAGGVIQTAYGVMKAGISTVLAAIYKAGEGMSWLTSAFLADLARIAEGIDAVTPDALTDRFKRAAAELQLNAQAAYAVSEEFGRRSAAAFDAAADGAETAANGWRTLTATSTEAAAATTSPLQQVEQQAGLTADQLDALGEGAQVASGHLETLGTAAQQSSAQQQTAAAAAQVQIAQLRQEYERLIAAGDTQQAAETLGEINRLLDGTAKQAKYTADQVDAAFQRLGVSSQASLKQAADAARRDFEIIRDSGVATPRDLSEAFAVYAEKAIAANGGVASESLKVEAAMRKVSIEADNAGRVTVQAMSAAKAATEQLSQAADEAGAKIAYIGREANFLHDAQGNLIDRSQQSNAAQGGGFGGGAINGYTERGAYDYAKQQGLTDAQALKIAADYISHANSVDALSSLNAAIDDMVLKNAKAAASAEQAAQSVMDSQQGATQRIAQQAQAPVRVDINLNGRTTAINTASAGDASALTSLLKQLEADMSRAR